MNVDIKQFVDCGTLGLLNAWSTLAELVDRLGDPDPCDYPGLYCYGPIVFDFGGGEGPPCSIQICFPHETYARPADSSWTDWRRPDWLDSWPDRRINWLFGPYQAGATLDDLHKQLVQFEEVEFLHPMDGSMRAFHNPRSGVQITFELQRSSHTLSHMMAFPIVSR